MKKDIYAGALETLAKYRSKYETETAAANAALQTIGEKIATLETQLQKDAEREDSTAYSRDYIQLQMLTAKRNQLQADTKSSATISAAVYNLFIADFSRAYLGDMLDAYKAMQTAAAAMGDAFARIQGATEKANNVFTAANAAAGTGFSFVPNDRDRALESAGYCIAYKDDIGNGNLYSLAKRFSESEGNAHDMIAATISQIEGRLATLV